MYPWFLFEEGLVILGSLNSFNAFSGDNGITLLVLTYYFYTLPKVTSKSNFDEYILLNNFFCFFNFGSRDYYGKTSFSLGSNLSIDKILKPALWSLFGLWSKSFLKEWIRDTSYDFKSSLSVDMILVESK